MTMLDVQSAPVDEVATASYAKLFHALSDESRLAILQHLSLGEHRVRDLVEHLGFAQSTVSKHLRCLIDCGLVTSRSVGRASYLELAKPDELAELLGGAEHLLLATGSRVTLCAALMHPGEER